MGCKVKVIEITNGNAATVQTAIQAAIDTLTILAGTVPSIAVSGGGRALVMIVYRET